MNLLAQVEVTTTSESSGGGASIVLFVVYAVIIVFAIAGLWKTIAKTGQPGAWALLYIICTPIFLIPVLKATGRPTWWVFLAFIPFVNIVVWFIVMIDLAKSFGKSTGFGVLLALFPFVFALILGFGQDEYRGPVVTA